MVCYYVYYVGVGGYYVGRGDARCPLFRHVVEEGKAQTPAPRSAMYICCRKLSMYSLHEYDTSPLPWQQLLTYVYTKYYRNLCNAFIVHALPAWVKAHNGECKTILMATQEFCLVFSLQTSIKHSCSCPDSGIATPGHTRACIRVKFASA